MSDNKERIEVINVLREGTNLTKWEEDFLDSMIERLEGGLSLTEAQEDKLAQIQAK